MSAPGLVLLALAWSGLVWMGAHLAARRRAPRTAQAVWRSAALLVPLPFLLSLVVPALPAPAAAPIADLPVLEPFYVGAGEVEAEAAMRGFALPDAATLILVLVAAGWAVRFGLWIVSQIRLQRLKARAMPVRRPLRHWAEALNLSRVPDVRLIPRGAPFLAGLRRPVVFIPSALAGQEGGAEIIVHEMVHLKRGDLVMRPLERLVADVFWFSPFAWAIRSQLDYWREAVVDEAAAGLTGDRIAYARALTRAARLARPVLSLPVAALVLKKEGTLRMRLNLLLTDESRPSRLGLVALAVLACAAPLAIAQGALIRGPGMVAVSGGAAGQPVTAYTHPVLDKAKLTSAFGLRVHPVTGEQKLHNGADLAAELGVAVYTPADGTVTRAKFQEGYGNLVEIAAAGSTLRFGQLDTIRVQEGEMVPAGAVIGTLGKSGTATGPHLHLEVWHGGEPVDPQTVDGLVLARELKVSAGAKPLAPLAPAADLNAPAVPASAPAAPPQEASGMPPACAKSMEDLKALPRPDFWETRLDAARRANIAAGLGGENLIPKTIVLPQPHYPNEAIEKKISAGCDVMFDLGTDGLPRNAAAHCTSPYFVEIAESLPNAKFEPATNANGEPVEFKGLIYPLQFCIH